MRLVHVRGLVDQVHVLLKLAGSSSEGAFVEGGALYTAFRARRLEGYAGGRGVMDLLVRQAAASQRWNTTSRDDRSQWRGRLGSGSARSASTTGATTAAQVTSSTCQR
jgi:hypothetical protein